MGLDWIAREEEEEEEEKVGSAKCEKKLRTQVANFLSMIQPGGAKGSRGRREQINGGRG